MHVPAPVWTWAGARNESRPEPPREVPVESLREKAVALAELLGRVHNTLRPGIDMLMVRLPITQVCGTGCMCACVCACV